ncbi:MAG: peptidase S8 [Candidatus Tumulicola sp.]
MNRNYTEALAIAGIALLAACSGGSMNQTVPAGTTGGIPQAMGSNAAPNTRAACASIPGPGFARCFALIRTDIAAENGAHPNVSGYGPADLQLAYNLPSSTKGTGQTVGIVDAFDDPKAESDLGTYRSNFGLPACTTANGCFKKVNQTGGNSYPSPDAGWAAEISLDLDMTSAICPNCKIVLVEATSNSFGNLGIAVDQAVTQGAHQVSNSYGGGEGGPSNPHFAHKHVAITASSGDGGYGAQQPCSYATVICVGGTTLVKGGSGRGFTETSWRGAGSGCSAVVKKPLYQKDTGCTMRSESDVSAVASPATGVAVYDSYPTGGWQVYGGTSVSSPIIGSVYALAGNAATHFHATSIWAAGGSSKLYDITAGASNGSCPPAYPYICTPGPGYDGVTGWGTPHGVGAF